MSKIGYTRFGSLPLPASASSQGAAALGAKGFSSRKSERARRGRTDIGKNGTAGAECPCRAVSSYLFSVRLHAADPACGTGTARAFLPLATLVLCFYKPPVTIGISLFFTFSKHGFLVHHQINALGIVAQAPLDIVPPRLVHASPPERLGNDNDRTFRTALISTRTV